MDFEWDPRKAHANQTKHGVSFTAEVSPFFRRRGITTGNDGRLMPDSYWLFLL